MPKQSPMKQAQRDRTLTPLGSRVVLTEVGISVQSRRDIVADASWAEVQVIYGYTRVLDRVARLCLDFVLARTYRRSPMRLAVDESVEGWTALTEELGQRFPGYDRDWRVKATCDLAAELAEGSFGSNRPNYVANVTQIWKKEEVPNQSSEPTLSSGTSPAGQELRLP